MARPAAARTGLAFAWGYNHDGELGDGTNTGTNLPVAVKRLASVTAVSAGSHHCLALLSSGKVMAWGDNFYGELGNGASINSDVPVAVKGLTGVKAVSAGGLFSLALLSNGTVKAWGLNTSGQLGDATFASSDLPVTVKGLAGVRAISAGGRDSLALLSNGTVRAWGSNTVGELGNGSTVADSNVPVAVRGLAGVKAISAGGFHGLALLSGGTVRAWGYNHDGELGNGTSTDSSLPVAVDRKSVV